MMAGMVAGLSVAMAYPHEPTNATRIVSMRNAVYSDALYSSLMSETWKTLTLNWAIGVNIFAIAMQIDRTPAASKLLESFTTNTVISH